MRSSLQILALGAAFVELVVATPYFNPRPFNALLTKRQSTSTSDLAVDLGYEIYQGVANVSTGLNTWKGIRYAAAPIGQLRWQPPRAPAVNRDQPIQANAYPRRCPQGADAPQPPNYNFTGTEDCLFLSVYSPQNATNLPVLVWIHGGGYGAGQGNEDLTQIINTNNNNFVGVAIQYRLGAFGFMSSDEIKRFGTPNAGLLDQTFALQWVQSYISQFGGNASQVTISGESAGGGSVMLQAMAFGGYLGNSLFENIIAASPYLPMQYGYADFVPSQSYYAFAQTVGCFDDLAQNNISNSIFQCLVGKDTQTLQNASAYISASSKFGTWGFLPVTDGVFIQQLPSQQLLKKQVNGARVLVGNNANEGVNFVPQNIRTEDDFINYVRNTFPLFTEDDVSKVLYYYPSINASVDLNTPDFATSGISGATALNESTYGSGQQQRADNLYAETTFVCPAYWLAEAYTNPSHTAYRYQYSVIGAYHASDVTGYFGPATLNQGPDFERAFMSIWGQFVTSNNPSIPPSVANGASENGTNTGGAAAENFPQYTVARPLMLNLNQTGGTPYSAYSYSRSQPNVTQFTEPGLRNAFSVVDAYAWEGGRGTRCDFWRSVGEIIPE